MGYLKSKGCDDAEALTQEVFLTLFSNLDTLTGGVAGVRSFTFSIAHARMVDDVRRRAREPESSPFDPLADRRSAESAEENVLNSQLGATDLLQGLNPQQREVLLLRIVADLSIAEAARIMGRSEGSVKQLQRRALAVLKDQMQGQEAAR